MHIPEVIALMSQVSFYCPSRSAYPISEHVASLLNIKASENRVYAKKNTAMWVPTWREMEKLLAGDERLPTNLLSKFPQCCTVCNKRETAKMFHMCRKIDPAEFTFWPETYLLPGDMEALVSVFYEQKHRNAKGKKLKNKRKKKNTFIIKPQDGAQGDGIFLVQTWKDLESKLAGKRQENFLAQRYLENPLTIEDKKFDLRVYLLITRLSPNLEVWLCKEGMVRLCTEDYKKPKSSNLHNVCSHLTNYSLNKRSDNYDHSHEDGKGSKRTLSSLFESLSTYGIDVGMFQEELEELGYKTAEAMSPYLQHNCNRHLPLTGGSGQCWQILGLDVMAESSTSGYKLHLLEINSNPSMAIDAICTFQDLTPREREIIPSKKFWVNGVGEPCNCRDGRAGHIHRVSHVDRRIKESVLAGALSIVLPRVKSKWASKNYEAVSRYQSSYVKLIGRPSGSYLVVDGLRKKYESLIGMDRRFEERKNMNSLKPLGAYKFRKFAKELLSVPRAHKSSMSILQADMLFSRKKSEIEGPFNFESFIDLMLGSFVPQAFPDLFPRDSPWSANSLMNVLQLQ